MIIRKICNVLALLLCFYSSTAQITNTPPSSFYKLKSVQVPEVIMPSFDLEKLNKEDAANARKLRKTFRFGFEHSTDLSIENSGIWVKMANGDRVWRITIVSPGAKTLNFVFDRFMLPPGATVHLYNKDKSFMLGAYTNRMNNKHNSLGTWICESDQITIEYFVPSSAKNNGELSIGKVIHGYRTVTEFEARTKSLESSGDCNLDVNCAVGSDFDPVKNRIKSAVALILVDNTGWCSGTLINNTANDEAPYLLTAFHCGDGEANWVFRFNWISPETICSELGESMDNGEENYYQTTSGSVNLAKSSGSDFRLIEITGGLSPDWDLEWVGWDRTEDVPSFTVGIHHPLGDIMKVSRDNDEPIAQEISIDGQVAQTWAVVDWDLGTTQTVSSGSGLFNENGQLIGQLFGGGSSCSGLTDNGQPDFYGRFNVAWNSGQNSATRLSDWLDPINSNQPTLRSLSEEMENPTVGGKLSDEVFVSRPNEMGNNQLFIYNTSDKRIRYRVFDMAGQQVEEKNMQDTVEPLQPLSAAAGMYFVRIFNIANDKDSFTKKVIISN